MSAEQLGLELRILKALPSTPLDQPYIFLSARQREKFISVSLLAPLAPLLPAWFPQRLIADALGHGQEGINLALQSASACSQPPWVWATEFENVHSFWVFEEPPLDIDGCRYPCSEVAYQAQKPSPFDRGRWDAVKVDVMRKAVRAKFKASAEARSLLLASAPHPLLSIKRDEIWGFDPCKGGQNLLAMLLMELRTEILSLSSSLCSTTTSGNPLPTNK